MASLELYVGKRQKAHLGAVSRLRPLDNQVQQKLLIFLRSHAYCFVLLAADRRDYPAREMWLHNIQGMHVLRSTRPCSGALFILLYIRFVCGIVDGNCESISYSLVRKKKIKFNVQIPFFISLLGKGLSNSAPSASGLANRFQLGPAIFFMSWSHLAAGRPTLNFPSFGQYAVTILVHLQHSSLQAGD